MTKALLPGEVSSATRGAEVCYQGWRGTTGDGVCYQRRWLLPPPAAGSATNDGEVCIGRRPPSADTAISWDRSSR
jgi:hypothetical protein